MPDTFVSDVGQIIDPAGRVTYDFDAHLHARGLDLDAGDTTLAPDDRRVRWLRQSDGAVVAELYAYSTPGQPATLLVETKDPDFDTFGTGFDVRAGEAIYAHVGSGSYQTILDGGFNSDFVRQGFTPGLMNIQGVYQVDSGPLNPGALSTAVLSHNLGTTVYPLAAQEDAFLDFALDISWQYGTINANQIGFAFRNQGPINGAAARFNFFLVTLT